MDVKKKKNKDPLEDINLDSLSLSLPLDHFLQLVIAGCG